MNSALTLIDVYYLIQWKEITPYTRFSNVSATRQKVAMRLQSLELLEFEPFLTVTSRGDEVLDQLEFHANKLVSNNG
jgi:hypothetical protein